MGKSEYMLTDDRTIVWLIEIQRDCSLFQAHIFLNICLITTHVAWLPHPQCHPGADPDCVAHRLAWPQAACARNGGIRA
jgi:hypothetical protein